MSLGTTALMFMTTGTAGCTRDITLLGPVGTAGDGGLAQDGQHAPAAGVSAAGGGGGTADAGVRLPTPDARTTGVACPGQGTAITLPTSSGAAAVCAATLATRGYRFALCTCETLGVLQPLKTDVFDSTSGAVVISAAAGIGVNTSLKATADIQVAGAVYVAGAEGLTSTKSLVMAGSLRVGGPFTVSTAETATDAYLAGEVNGFLSVRGRLHVPSTPIVVDGGIVARGGLVVGAISVPPPCPCDPTFVNIAGALAATAAHNDNGTIGLSQDRLTAVRASTAVDIPCGQYALSKIDATEAVFLAVRGRALLAVAGDVVLHAGLTVTLDPGAELDLLIGGALQANGPYPLGADFPARFRVWVAAVDRSCWLPPPRWAR